MSKYLIGVDGGGTKTLGAIFKMDGEIVERYETGFANFSANEEVSKANIEKTLDHLVKKLTSSDELVHIQLGIAGHSKFKKKAAYLKHLSYRYKTSVAMTNDALIALYSVKKASNMNVIMVLGGTGSVIMSSNGEGYTIIGGFGHLLGDNGSSYHLAITALKNVISEYEENQEFSKLSQALLAEIGAKDHYEISKFVYNSTKSEIASLSMFISKLALNGNQDAIKLFVDEGKSLTKQTYDAYQKLGTNEKVIIGIKGGFLLNAPYVKETFINELNKLKINYEILKDQVEPVVGAYYLGLKKISKE